MRMLEVLLVVAAIVVPLLALLVWLETEVADWQHGVAAREVGPPDAHYNVQCAACKRVALACWERDAEQAAGRARELGWSVEAANLRWGEDGPSREGPALCPRCKAGDRRWD